MRKNYEGGKMDLLEHKNSLIDTIQSEECYSKNILIALLELKKQEIVNELLKDSE